MSVNAKNIKAGQYYAAGRQVREVLEVAMKDVRRLDSRTRKNVKTRRKRVRYHSRGHKAGSRFGSWYWVDIEKFARDVDKLVDRNYDYEYDSDPMTR